MFEGEKPGAFTLLVKCRKECVVIINLKNTNGNTGIVQSQDGLKIW